MRIGNDRPVLTSIILIGLELIETAKTYLEEGAVHVELVLLVAIIAIIAIARKVVVWDFDKHSHTELQSLAIMVLALAISYFLVKHSMLKIPLWSGGTQED